MSDQRSDGTASSLLGRVEEQDPGPACWTHLGGEETVRLVPTRNGACPAALKRTLDRIKARVDDHDSQFDHLETQTSELEDQRYGEQEQLLRMERVLELYALYAMKMRIWRAGRAAITST
ncbi:hypothetical protein NDU88_001860 [Pleurodeles waltl]|uniref:Uncharacterized protein n=1 Tax=Pleurodeles waltl TaxID=8319 RepID=A0AAV7WJQ9_PLEWA|nr:hypothetical protein NDU88_001860 [Pleurodeles waltl]